jgi:hypothetical protein
MDGELIRPLASIVAVVVGGILAFHVHERTHYYLARIWTDDLHIQYSHKLLPHRVLYESPEDLPSYAIRIVGGGPILYTPLFLVALQLWTHNMNAVNSLLLGTTVAGLAISPSDLLALLRPNVWRKMAIQGSERTHKELLELLLGIARVENQS